MMQNEGITRFLKRFSTEGERNWLKEQLRKKGMNVSESDTSWSETVLQHYLISALSQEPKILDKIQNNWRQYKYVTKNKHDGIDTIKLNISHKARVELSSLSKSLKKPINNIVELLIFDNYQTEMSEIRIEKRRQQEIRLEKKKSEESRAKAMRLSESFNKIDGKEQLIKDLDDANSKIDELSNNKTAIELELEKLQEQIKQSEAKVEALAIELNAEKRITSKLSQELRSERDDV